MASYDPEYANSSGYFRDPSTGLELSVDTPRVIECALENGKFIWPQVAAADGSMLMKIVYKYFTDEEKELYKQYRGRGIGEPRQRKVTLRSEPKEQVEKPVSVQEPEQVVKYNSEGATSLQTLMILAQCNECWGVSWIDGIAYGLVAKCGENKVYHIPRSCIPDDEWDRICTGGVA